MRRSKRWEVVLILTTLWLTLSPVWVAAAPAQPDSVWVSKDLLRRSTARIDQLELKLMILDNRAVEVDSLRASERVEWEGRLVYAYEWGERWEDVATSWWHKNESAFWAILGMLATALALN